jgi:DNA invertase Pin-like site-specific DNA recombinase
MEQASEGVSLAAQRVKIEAYAVVKDWTLMEVVRDDGASAKSLHRPGLAHVLALVKAGAVQAVVVAKLDRLTRSVSDLDKLMKLFARKNVALVSLQESLDATTATGRLMMNLLASVSQWEREVIGERTAEAMQHLKASGKVYSRPVFDDASTLARIHTMRSAGVTYQEIADELTAAGIPTVRGGTWAPATIMGILRRHPLPAAREAA